MMQIPLEASGYSIQKGFECTGRVWNSEETVAAVPKPIVQI